MNLDAPHLIIAFTGNLTPSELCVVMYFFTVVEAEYDTTQGEPVAQKEVGRHSTVSASIETEKKAHQPAAEAGGHGGAAT